jgi:hypothetical protein
LTSLVKLTTKAIGTVIGRKTSVGTKKYKQVMIYVPSQISLDSLFQSLFGIGSPVEIDVDGERKVMTIKPITEKEAREKGWLRRKE